jgi:hypothetical protein
MIKTDYKGNLAYDYLQVYKAVGKGRDGALGRASIIENEQQKIIDFYKQKGSLKDLKIKGIGDGIKDVLEMILSKGVAHAAEKLNEAFIERDISYTKDIN